MFVKLINKYTPMLDYLYVRINLGVHIRKGDSDQIFRFVTVRLRDYIGD